VTLLVGLVLAASATYWHGAAGKLPDPHYTPGLVAVVDEIVICAPDYLKMHPSRIPREVEARTMALYGRAPYAGCCKIDHRVPFSLGGSDDPANLWPQDWDEAHRKEITEAVAWDRVCATHDMSLKSAQEAFMSDFWEIVPQLAGQP
jgi:hypothetical protein